MAVVMSAGGGLPPRAARRQEALEYRLVYLAGFAVFLAVAVATRLLPGRQRHPQRRRRSIVGEARAAADTFIPFAFMG
jgi:NaMN:DMB phosphoribosyltransferase